MRTFIKLLLGFHTSAPPPTFGYRRPDGTSLYFRPGGVFTYVRP